MNMTGVEDRSGGDDGASPNGEDSSVTLRSTIIPAAETAKHWMKNYRTSIASSTSSMLAGGIVYPLDTIKINMQGGTHPTVRECIREMYRKDGIRVFWRSFTVPTVSVTMVRTTTFSIYQKAKYSYSAAIGKATGGEDPLVIVNKPGSTPTYATVGCFAAAGLTAGSLSVLMSCPFELVKIATQVSGISNKGSMDDPVRQSYQKKGSFRTAKNLVVQRGVLGLYSGFRIQLLRDSIGSTIYFATYESTKQLLVKFQGSNNPTSPLSVAISGGVCGMTAWICTYPIDTAKTKYQHKCLSKTKGQDVKRPEIDYFNLKQYRGLGVSLARTGLTNAIFFSAFEYLKRNINALPDTILDAMD